MTRLAATLVACAISLATPVLSQDVYWGAGLASSSGTSDQVTGGAGSSELSAGLGPVIVGQRIDRGAPFYGWGTSAELSLVGVLGASVGQGTDVFGTLGVGILKGDFADSSFTTESASVKGLTAGLGLGHAFGNGLVGRGEVIYDKFNSSSQEVFSSEYSGTTVRFSVLRRF